MTLAELAPRARFRLPFYDGETFVYLGESESGWGFAIGAETGWKTRATFPLDMPVEPVLEVER